jgi:hypothetical protein
LSHHKPDACWTLAFQAAYRCRPASCCPCQTNCHD